MLSERHGDWEPFLERFDFGLSLNLAKSTNLTVQPCGTGRVFCWVSIFSGGGGGIFVQVKVDDWQNEVD